MSIIRGAIALTTVLFVHTIMEAWTLHAAQTEATEYELKAAFLMNFASYVNWPEEVHTDEALVFGVLGAHELAENLEAMSNERRVSGQSVEVRRLSSMENISDLHVLFVSREFTDFAVNILAGALGNSVLTVTEKTPRPANSVINFELVDSRVRFDVSLTAAEVAGLTVSSRLLQVAHQVIGPD